MEVAPTFWRGKKVFLTGHTGFKGGWLSLWLQRLGAQVCGYALPPSTDPSLFQCARIAEGMSSVEGDVRDAARLRNAISQYRPDIVFHLAAQPLVLPSYADPVDTFSTNVMGTVHLLEAVRHCDSIGVLVVVTSDKCYQNQGTDFSFRESDPMGGHDPYSSSKGCAELVTAGYRDSYFSKSAAIKRYRSTSIASVRAGNVVGGGDWSPYRLVPDVVRALLGKQPIAIRRPEFIRPWQHVLEPLSGYLLLAERLWLDGAVHANAWNFGPHHDDAWPVSRVVDNLVQLWGERDQWSRDSHAYPGEAALLRLDWSKAKTQLGWEPTLRLAKALEWIVQWFKAYRDGEDMRAVTERQIEQHQLLARSRSLAPSALMRHA